MKALITGITGQDGSYLAEHLLSLGYEVHGTIRRSSSFNTARIDHLYKDPHDPQGAPSLRLHYADMTDKSSLERVLSEVMPDEIYNLAAQSHVRLSFEIPKYTLDTIVTGTINLLESFRQICPGARMYQASSSEMFGDQDCAPLPLNESTSFNPRSPYAAAKVCAHNLCRTYRDGYGLYISCGILFNHESPRRSETFVTRKITRAVGRIKHGLQKDLYLGNLNAVRDWGYAGDYVKAMHELLLCGPTDIVIATGGCHSVREFARVAFNLAGLDWMDYVKRDSRYLRPTEVHWLRGETLYPSMLKWKPEVGFDDLVKMMVDSDLNLAQAEAAFGDTRSLG